jgi:two-component system, NtrC family, response regulator HydG
MRSPDSLATDLVAEDHTPGVRLRAEDLLVLADHFLRKLALEHRKTVDGFTDAAREKIAHYKGLEDVRDLERAIGEAVVGCAGARIDAGDLSFEGPPPESSVTLRIPGTTIAELERHAIIRTLEVCGGSTAKAAEMLGISIRTIQYRMHAYGLRGQNRESPVSEREASLA